MAVARENVLYPLARTSSARCSRRVVSRAEDVLRCEVRLPLSFEHVEVTQ